MDEPGTGADGHGAGRDVSAGSPAPAPWWIYTCAAEPHDGILRLPAAPSWRTFADESVDPSELMVAPDFAGGSRGYPGRGRNRQAFAYQAEPEEIHLVNMAMLLRRPLLVTGSPGVGKSTLALSIARELGLGPVLRWSITSRSTLQDGQYRYDAIGRLQEVGLHGRRSRRYESGPAIWEDGPGPGAGISEAATQELEGCDLGADPQPDTAMGDPGDRGGSGTAAGSARRAHGGRPRGRGAGLPGQGVPDIGRYLQLGPLGTAFLPWQRPRVLLIDEIDKGDVDLPNDLLGIFEEGEFVIPELARMKRRDATVMTEDDGGTATLIEGRVRCHDFPIVIMTSNGEREFPAAFMRRCIRLKIDTPSEKKLKGLVAAHFPEEEEGGPSAAQRDRIIALTMARQADGAEIANDQLLNAVQLASRHQIDPKDDEILRELIDDHILRPLNRD
jgi:MoxR-like ATPase